jgi:hypothetical protein
VGEAPQFALEGFGDTRSARSLRRHRADCMYVRLRVHRYPDNSREFIPTRGSSDSVVGLAKPDRAVVRAQHPATTAPCPVKLAPWARRDSPVGGRRQSPRDARTGTVHDQPCRRPARAASACRFGALAGPLARYRTGREVGARRVGCASPRRAEGWRRGCCAVPARPCPARLTRLPAGAPAGRALGTYTSNASRAGQAWSR